MQGWHRHGLNRCSPSTSVYIPIVKTAGRTPLLFWWTTWLLSQKFEKKTPKSSGKPYIFIYFPCQNPPDLQKPQTYQGLLPVWIIALLLGFRPLSFLCLRLVIRAADVDLGQLDSVRLSILWLKVLWTSPKISQNIPKNPKKTKPTIQQLSPKASLFLLAGPTLLQAPFHQETSAQDSVFKTFGSIEIFSWPWHWRVWWI